MQTREYTFPVRAFVNLSPDGPGVVKAHVQVYARILDLAPLDAMSLGPNAREPEAGSRTAPILTTLNERPEMFQYVNKGLCIVAEDCTVEDGKLTIISREREEGERVLGHGLVDGGHTRYAMTQARKATSEVGTALAKASKLKQALDDGLLSLAEYRRKVERVQTFERLEHAWVRLEVMRVVATDSATIQAISKGRNTQVTVDTIGVEGLDGRYQEIARVVGASVLGKSRADKLKLKQALKLILAYTQTVCPTEAKLKALKPDGTHVPMLEFLKRVELPIAREWAKHLGGVVTGGYRPFDLPAGEQLDVPARCIYETLRGLGLAATGDIVRAEQLWNRHGPACVAKMYTEHLAHRLDDTDPYRVMRRIKRLYSHVESFFLRANEAPIPPDVAPFAHLFKKEVKPLRGL